MSSLVVQSTCSIRNINLKYALQSYHRTYIMLTQRDQVFYRDIERGGGPEHTSIAIGISEPRSIEVAHTLLILYRTLLHKRWSFTQ